MLLNVPIIAERFGERGIIVSMLAFLSPQGFKGEPGEDGLMVSIAQQRPCVHGPPPSPPITLRRSSARCSKWFCVTAYGKTHGKLQMP